MKAKEMQNLVKKYQALAYIKLDKLTELKNAYFPDAEIARIKAGSEYNDEGYSVFPEVSFYKKSEDLEVEIPDPDFGEDWKEEGKFYDMQYNLSSSGEAGEDFSCPSITYDFSTDQVY